MSDLKFDIDVQGLAETFQELKKQVAEDLTKAAGNLAEMTHAKTLELARDDLGSLSQQYQDNIEFSNPMENFWIVTLKEPALWIEEGRKSGFMSELLEGKSAKVSKDGKKYAVIPFEHSKNPSEQSGKARELAGQIKDAMKEKGISWGKIEKNTDGSPRVGRLHTFNLESARLKPHHKTSATQGITVYQTKDKKTGNVRRDVMTFRVITEDHEKEGLWKHPGRDGSKIMDKALDWAMNAWETEILPSILSKFDGGR